MAHNLARRADGEIAMAYVRGQTPWHGLGQALSPDSPIEVWAQEAGYTFQISRSRVRYQDAAGSLHVVNDRHILFADDNPSQYLSIVSDDYKIVQPMDVIAFFKDICAKHGFLMTTAGFMRGRRVMWAQADIGAQEYIADPADVVKGKLLLSTSCDGTMPTSGRFVARQVVCENTINMALAEKGGTVAKVRHKTQFDVDDLKSRLGIGTVAAQFRDTIDNLRKLAETPWTPAAMLYHTYELYRPGEFLKTDPEKSYKIANDERSPISHVLRLAVNDLDYFGAEIKGGRGTAYRWLNAVTQFVDHHGRARTADARLDTAWFGAGVDVKLRALDLALASTSATPVPLAIASEVAQAGGQSGADWIASLQAGRAVSPTIDAEQVF